MYSPFSEYLNKNLFADLKIFVLYLNLSFLKFYVNLYFGNNTDCTYKRIKISSALETICKNAKSLLI